MPSSFTLALKFQVDFSAPSFSSPFSLGSFYFPSFSWWYCLTPSIIVPFPFSHFTLLPCPCFLALLPVASCLFQLVPLCCPHPSYFRPVFFLLLPCLRLCWEKCNLQENKHLYFARYHFLNPKHLRENLGIMPCDKNAVFLPSFWK